MSESSEAIALAHTPPKLFISFSANAEDVILHRLFGGRTDGFYVDVGAAHPTFENDTKALYDQGWSGINIEPNPGLFLELQSGRPRDRNLQVALSDEAGTIDYWEVVGTGLSTCDADEAQRARTKGFEVRQIPVTCTTLAAVLAEAGASAIDLLKIDVEGFELRVLLGNDWSRYRPSVIVAEATYPETPIRRADRIRPLLEQQGYDFAYFDGLNDFFVDRGFPVPADVFRPTNVFDRVVHHTVISLREHVANLERDRNAKDEYVEVLLSQIGGLERERDSLRAEASALRSEREALCAEVTGLHIRSAREREEAARAIESANLQGERVLALRRELELATRAEASLHRLLAERDSSLSHALAEIDKVRSELGATYASKSWRATSPLRDLSGLISRVRH